MKAGLTGVVASLVLAAAPPGRYRITADIINDTVTGLGWQRRVVAATQRFDWAGASAYCEGLELDGFTDWRLPDVKELQTTVDETSTGAPVVDGAAFPSTLPSPFWTSTESVSDTQNAFAVSFDNGAVLTFRKSFRFPTRCVR